MHVVIGEATIDPARIRESLDQLHQVLIPFMSRAPGFLSGYWLRSTDGSQAMSVLIFDTEAHATAAAQMRPPDSPSDPPADGVTLGVYEVVGTA